MIRAIRRSGLPYKITAGCHTRPKLSFGPPLPLGHSSSCETIDLSLISEVRPEAAFEMLSQQAPSGIQVLRVESIPVETRPIASECVVRYRFTTSDTSGHLKSRMVAFLSDSEKMIGSPGDDRKPKVPIGKAPTILDLPEGAGAGTLLVDFDQGKPGVPSASKIITVLLEELGETREQLLDVERVAINPAP